MSTLCRVRLAYFLNLAALLCYEYPVQGLFASGLSAIVVVGCVHSHVGLIAPLLCYEYPARGLFR